MTQTFINKLGLSLLTAALLVSPALKAASVTVGSLDSGNCYPFGCNDSGTSSGISIDYQQVYRAGAVGSMTIGSISWLNYPAVGNGVAIGGGYHISWGYAALGTVGNLSSTLSSNYTSGPHFLGTLTIPTGGIDMTSGLTFSGFTPFNYDSSLGDLLLEIVVENQDLVPSGSGNGYLWADYTGSDTTRAFVLTNGNSEADETGGLVTTFSGPTSVPEPSSWTLMASAFLAFAGCLRRGRK